MRYVGREGVHLTNDYLCAHGYEPLTRCEARQVRLGLTVVRVIHLFEDQAFAYSPNEIGLCMGDTPDRVLYSMYNLLHMHQLAERADAANLTYSELRVSEYAALQAIPD